MRVGFVGKMPPTGYSGGRLAALTYAESLASAGVSVTFFTNCVPEMAHEFAEFSAVNYEIGPIGQSQRFQWHHLDWVVIVPHMGDVEIHDNWVNQAVDAGCKVALLNFESGNWFNSLSNVPRSLDLWEGWQRVAEGAEIVLSLSEEGSVWAKKFYESAASECVFAACYPSINSRVADGVMSEPTEKTDTILVLSRKDHHKGLDMIKHLAMPELRGFEVVLHLGNGHLEPFHRLKLALQFSTVGMRFSVSSAIAGSKKFAKLASARALFFPTRFEGFGIPPLEAAYCGTAVITSDLPVLREFGKNDFFYFDNALSHTIRDSARSALDSCSKQVDYERLKSIAEFERSGRELKHILFG